MSTLLNLSSNLLSLSKAKQGWFYIFNQGFLYAGSRLVSASVRLSASLLLSLTGEPFEVEIGGGPQTSNAFMVRPGVWRCVSAPRTPVISIGVCPGHESFRHFSTSPHPTDLWAVSREAFTDYDDLFHAARGGLLSPLDASTLSRSVVTRARQFLPEPQALDHRIEHVRALLEKNPSTSMMQLASTVDLSYHRLSHLFSQEMGITLRMYAIQQKLDSAGMRAGQGLTLTQIALCSGFADSAHFCRTWMRNVGSPPSQLLNNQYVGIRSAYGQG